MTIKLKDNERLDDLQRNGYQIIQNPKKFCFGMDAVLLSGFVEAKPNQTILDLGTGNGIIPLLLAGKTNQTKIYGLEIQNESVDMAKRSVQLNNLEDHVAVSSPCPNAKLALTAGETRLAFSGKVPLWVFSDGAS